MTTLSPVSSVLSRPLNRGDLGLFILALFFVAVQPPLENSMSLLSIVNALANQNLFFLFAMLVAASRFWESGSALSLTRADWVIAILAALLFGVVGLFGVDQVAGLVLTLMVPALYFAGPRNLNFKAALLVCSALAVNSFWGPLLFQSFTGEIISLDTTLLKWTYGLLRPDIVANGTTFSAGKAFGIIVIGGCSVFNSASVAFLASTAMAQHLKPGFRKRDAVVLGGVLLAMIAINTFRLALMGWGAEQYHFWHNGPGSPYFAAAQTFLIAAFAYLGARWSVKKSA